MYIFFVNKWLHIQIAQLIQNLLSDGDSDENIPIEIDLDVKVRQPDVAYDPESDFDEAEEND